MSTKGTPTSTNNKSEFQLDVEDCTGLDYTACSDMMEADSSSTRHSYEDLRNIEKERREILRRAELPSWKILTFWNGTCLRALVTDWLVWVPFIIYVSIRIRAHRASSDQGDQSYNARYGYYNFNNNNYGGNNNNNNDDDDNILGNTDLDILGGFLSFLLVLFVNQTNTRFYEMYNMARQVSGKIQDVAGVAHAQFQSSPEAAARLVRYLNAAHVIAYVGLPGPTYRQENLWVPLNGSHQLLTPNELSALPSLHTRGDAAFKQIITWCQQQIQQIPDLDTIQRGHLQKSVLEVRSAIDGIYDYCDQTPHFFYVHFLCLLNALYLPLFAINNAYSAGWGDDSEVTAELVNGMIVLLQSIFVVGLRLLGRKMLDPFGDDLEDLSVLTYLTTTIDSCREILRTQLPPSSMQGKKYQRYSAN